jgi:ABC-2 type transport system permease protein
MSPTAIVARQLTPVGRRPELLMAREVSRRAVRSGALWGTIFAVYVVVQAFGYIGAYKTQAARDRLAASLGNNIGINALIGPARAINTVAGYVSWRALGVLSILGAIWGLLTSTRLMRGEEEAGRYDLLLSGPTTRRRGAAQTLSGLGAGLATLLVLTAIGCLLTGASKKADFTAGESLYFALTLVCGAAEFLAVGALTSQLAATRRRAASFAAVVFGVSYALRMIADSTSGLHWVVWLSPLGWIEEAKPLTHPRPVALLPVFLSVALLCAVTLHLAGNRDLGASTLADADTAPARLTLVANPTLLAMRLMRPVAIGWLLGVAALSVLIGTVAQSAAKALTGSTAIQDALDRLGGHSGLVEAYIGLTFLILATIVALMSAGQATAVRQEESESRLENIVVRPYGRIRWFAGRLMLSALLVCVAGIVAGIGAWAGSASQHSGVSFARLLAAGLNIVPPAVFLLGIGAAVMGVRPRWTPGAVYGYLGWSFLIEFVGAVVKANHWLLDTSVFFHMAPAPATNPNWASGSALVGIGLAGALVGAGAFGRRDIQGA